jgi:hypothetical protein
LDVCFFAQSSFNFISMSSPPPKTAETGLEQAEAPNPTTPKPDVAVKDNAEAQAPTAPVSVPAPTDPKVLELIAMFPTIDVPVIELVLETSGGSVDRAIETLLGMTDPDFKPDELGNARVREEDVSSRTAREGHTDECRVSLTWTLSLLASCNWKMTRPLLVRLVVNNLSNDSTGMATSSCRISLEYLSVASIHLSSSLLVKAQRNLSIPSNSSSRAVTCLQECSWWRRSSGSS